jgi:hypothetical protein
MHPVEAAGEPDGHDDQRDADDCGQLPIEIAEHAEGENCGEAAAHELEHAGAEEVVDVLGVRHHSGDERTGWGGVEKADWEPKDVPLQPLPESGDHPLAGECPRLRGSERRQRLDQNRDSGAEHDREN